MGSDIIIQIWEIIATGGNDENTEAGSCLRYSLVLKIDGVL